MKNNIFKFVRKYWIALSVVVVIGAASLGYMAHVSADSTFSFDTKLSPENGFDANYIRQYGSQTIRAFATNMSQWTDEHVGYDEKYLSWQITNQQGEPDSDVIIKFAKDSNGQTIKTGEFINITSIAAGIVYLKAVYDQLYHLDADGNVSITATNNPQRITATASKLLQVKIPLVTHIETIDGTILTDDYIVDVGEEFIFHHNGYVKYDEYDNLVTNNAHGTTLSYNSNVIQENNTGVSLESGNVDLGFKTVGAGSSAITATVDGITEATGQTIYVGAKFQNLDKDTGIVIKQGEIFTISQNNTNILNNNFSADADGNYNVFFWTHEDYQRYLNEKKGSNETIIQVAQASQTGVVTGTYAGITTLYASCRPMEESYDGNGNLLTQYADSIKVTVPFLPYFEDTVVVGVGDNIPIKTSAYIDNTKYTLYNNDGVIDQTQNKDIFKAIKAGEADVWVTAGYYEDGVKKETAPITVHVKVIDKLTLSTDSISLNIGSSQVVTAYPTCTDSTIGSTLAWTVSDPTKVAISYDDSSIEASTALTVTALGKTPALNPVIVTCTQTVDGVVKIATFEVNVTVPVTGITLSEPKEGRDHMVMYLNESATIYAYLGYDNNDVPDNTELVWTVSGEKILDIQPVVTSGVTQSCMVKATALGETTLTVYSTDSNEIVTCDIYVSEAPTKITLSDTSVLTQMSLGQYQLKATVESANGGADQSVEWKSLDESVCTVDPVTGLVTYVAPGTTYISAVSLVDPSVVAYCYFEIAQDVHGVDIDVQNIVINVGDTYRVTASIDPSDAYDKTIKWESSNTDIVTVENTDKYENLITAKGSGTCTVFAKTNDGGYIAYCNVRVLQPVTSISISDTEVSVRKGTDFYLDATPLPSDADDKSIVWTSSDPAIATVTSTGKVETLAVGQCTITATNQASGVYASCVVTVLDPVTGLNLNTYYQNMIKGTKFVLVPNVEPITAANKNVTFWSSDETVATVDSNGVIEAINGGACEIMVVTEECALTAKCTIVVTEFVSSIELSDDFKYVNKGGSYTLKADVKTDTASNKAVVWSSSDNAIAIVNEKGVVTAIDYGTAVITATAADGSGISDSCVIQVINPITGITLIQGQVTNEDKITLYVKETAHITATIIPQDATVKKLTWTSTDESIAKVYDNGDIEGISPGRCKVVVSSTDDSEITAEINVVVKEKTSATALSINSHEILMLTGKTRKLTARMYPTNASESVKWLSTDTSVVVVDGNGQITTVGPGKCEIVAYTSLGTLEDRCTVYSMAISKSSMQLEQYDTFNLYVDGAPSGASWRTTNARIATVNQNGLVTARMPGECTITATIDGKTVSCSIKVMAVDPGKFINIKD